MSINIKTDREKAEKERLAKYQEKKTESDDFKK